ncbi:MAG: hypothetical protein DWQ35_16240 [Planctomycetota bacterium]|nr:MAG: hypothetical protein DWQ35_16240 [Planctomycetota bacterium]
MRLLMTTDPLLLPVLDSRRFAFLVALLSAICGGCWAGSDSRETGPDPVELAETNAIVDEMIEAYRQARSYRDRGVILWDGEIRGAGTRHQRFRYALEFVRPNRLRLAFEPYGSDATEIYSDGEYLHAAFPQYDNQLLEATAPDTIAVPDLYEDESLAGLFRPTVACRLTSEDPQRFASLPLDLLTGADPLNALREADDAPRRLESRTIGEELCDGVRYRFGDDDVTLWISQQRRLLRRLQVAPSKVDPSASAIERITINFRDAEFDAEIEVGRFQWDRTGAETVVERVVRPTGDLTVGEPGKLVGKPMPNLSFLHFDGSRADIESLRGKFVVIDMWATFCQPCRRGLPSFAALRDQYSDRDDVVFLALNLDDPRVTRSQVMSTLVEWGVDLPLTRVVDADIKGVFEQLEVEAIPVTVIVDPGGIVRYVKVGAHPKTVEQLPEVVEAVLSYPERLAEATIVDGSHAVPLAEAKIAKPSEPNRWTRTRLWSQQSISGAGNLLVVSDAGGSPRVFAVASGPSIVELDAQGQLVTRHTDLVPAEMNLTILRSGRTGEGERLFALSGLGAPQLFVFNDRWEQQFAYPEEPGAGAVYDVAVDRFSAEGSLHIFAGYFGQAGVHVLDAEGKRLWRSRALQSVGDMAVADAQEEVPAQLLCANDTGSLIPLDETGAAAPAWRYENRAIPYIASADFGGAERALCGVTVDLHGGNIAVGLARDGSVAWQYVLPSGQHTSHLDPLTYVSDPTVGGYWVFAATDGSIHWVSADGKTADYFATGRPLRGLAATRLDGKLVVVAAHAGGVTAWALEPKAGE